MPFDAYIEKYFLITIDENNTPISTLEIAKYEAHWGSDFLKFCMINENLEIDIHIHEKIEDFDTGEEKVNESFERYSINKDGVIQKL